MNRRLILAVIIAAGLFSTAVVVVADLFSTAVVVVVAGLFSTAVAIIVASLFSTAEARIDERVAAYKRDDYETPLREMKLLAQQGDAEAQYNLGAMYDEGQGVPQSDTEAAQWFRKAAERGLAEAQYNLGIGYRDGQGVAQDYGEAVMWHRKAAKQGDADALYNLGVMYLKGWGVPQDDVQAHMPPAMTKAVVRAGARTFVFIGRIVSPVPVTCNVAWRGSL